jgi:hypothetical protein
LRAACQQAERHALTPGRERDLGSHKADYEAPTVLGFSLQPSVCLDRPMKGTRLLGLAILMSSITAARATITSLESQRAAPGESNAPRSAILGSHVSRSAA